MWGRSIAQRRGPRRRVGFGRVLLEEFVVEQPQRSRPLDLALPRLRRPLAFAVGLGAHIKSVASIEVRVAEEQLLQGLVAYAFIDLRRREGSEVGLGRQSRHVVQRRGPLRP
jgi:hypothetical protein